MAEVEEQSSAQNERRMAQNLAAQRNKSDPGLLEQASPSFQAASQVGGAIGLGGAGKSDEEYGLLDAIWEVLVVSVLIWWGEGLATLSAWLMEGLTPKNIKRLIVVAMMIALTVGMLMLIISVISDLPWSIVNYITLGVFQ